MALEAVVDPSVFLALLLEEELTPNAYRFMESGPIIHAMEFTSYEIAHVLGKQVRGKKLSRHQATSLFDEFQGFGPLIWESLVDYDAEKFSMSLDNQLSPYDQAYLLLAAHLNIPLVSNDKRHIELGAKPLADF